MFRGGIRLGRVFGIEVDIDASWFLIFLLVTFNLALGVFPALHPGWGAILNWGIGLLASLLFFGSVLAHELAHSLVARRRGLPVDKITLFLFGGVSNIEEEPPSPGTEFLIAFVGPLTSIILGVIFLLLGVGLARTEGFTGANLGESLGRLGPFSTLLLWLGPINILLGVFNLIPGFPLDGGRLLRSILWAVTDDLKKATQYAAFAGQAFGWLFIAIGVAMALGIEVPFFGSGLIGGLWLVFIGWFLSSLAVQGYQQVVAEDVLGKVSVAEIMRQKFPAVRPDISVEELVNEHIMGSENRAFPVMTDEKLLGLVTLDDIRKIPRNQWQKARVEQIMTPREKLITVTPENKATEALKTLAREDVNQLPVVKDEKLVGLVSRRDIILWLQVRSGREDLADYGL
ncbi:MAG TPA: site-2 protease family protein [Patescibacteria group bacterium]|nr:site-2 protease family protein [Patescibacteria group bacterium]